MGYVHGKGLGVKKQGIVEPISAKRNRGRTGVGVSKSRGPTTVSYNGLASSQTMPNLSPTCVTVKPIGLSSTQLQKYTNYLLNYFGIFGRIEKVNFDAQGANISFNDPASADLCLQQEEHIIDGIDCEVTRAEASIPKVSIPKVSIPTLSSLTCRPPPAQPENTDFSKTRISVERECLGLGKSWRKSVKKWLRLQKTSLLSYFGKFGTVEKIDFSCQVAIITFKNANSADLCVQQNQHSISGINCQVTRTKASKNEKKQMREALQKNLSTQKKLLKKKKNLSTQKKLLTKKNVSTPIVQPGPSRGFAHATGALSTRAEASIPKVSTPKVSIPTLSFHTCRPLPPGSSRGSAHATGVLSTSIPKTTVNQNTQTSYNLSPSEVHSITVSGICLDSSLTANETKAFYSPYFSQFGIVTSVKRISDSEATVVFQNFAALENALRAGTIKFDGKDCKITRSAASTSTELSGKKQETMLDLSQKAAQNPYPRLPFQASFQQRNEMPYTFPIDGRDTFNADFNSYGTSAAYGQSWRQPYPAETYSRPTYSDRPLPYNPTFPSHYQTPYNGPAIPPFNGPASHTNSYIYQAPGPSTRYLAPGPSIYY
ncbi:g-patch domain-containing protein [Ditylenchus destructor]|nr:g-patch domain-containing protein [Ditylenchus destructor]